MTRTDNLPNVDDMRIAVISDTHGHYPADLPEKLHEADEIWHLGDVGEPGTLVEFEQLGVPVRVVRGNCDNWMAWPLALDLVREDVAFHLVHIPPKRVPPGTRVLLHGHLHVPRDEVDVRGVRWLSPGCISQPRGKGCSFGWLTVEAGRFRWAWVKL
ncbi:MAG: phosphodiesterase [Rariglobus sp.]|jgi:putative phosphoesterase|nr:phosphodiesterase [Rariglobus sp.]